MGLVTTDMNISATLRSVELIPDVLDSDVNSSTLLQIVYDKSDKEVTLGNNLSPTEAKEKPLVSFVPLNEADFYTLVMTDPDAPSRHDHKFGPWRHWVVVNISGKDVEQTVSLKENQHTPYIGPGPGEGTGIHRYTFLLYKQLQGQSQRFKPMEHAQKEDRRKFDIRQFESENQLQLVSVNFFCCPT